MMETTKLSAKFTLGNGTLEVPACSRRAAVLDSDRPYSVLEVLTQFYGQNISGLISSYLEQEREALLTRPEFSGAWRLRLHTCRVEEVRSALGQKLDSTVVDLILGVCIESEVVKTTEYGWARKWEAESDCESVFKTVVPLQFQMRYVLDLRPCAQKCIGPLIKIVDEEGNDPRIGNCSFPVNEYLLPVLHTEDYDKMAHQMISDYYPEESADLRRRGDFCLRAEDLANQMGLRIMNVHFADPTLLGKLYYTEGSVELFDRQGKITAANVRPGTILVSIDQCKDPAVRNSTIMHECCHMYLDKWYFMLQLMTGQPAVASTNRKIREKRAVSKKKGPLEWMEIQCEKLPAYVLLESISTKKFADEWLSEAGSRGIAEMRGLIAALARRCNVSFAMAKFRLIELGYPEAEGIRSYINGRNIPDYGCAGHWRDGITYTISLPDAAELMREDPQFRAKLRREHYTYAEGHFVRKNRRYVFITPAGEAVLTPYARSHVDECCLAFRRRSSSGSVDYQMGCVSRHKKEPVEGQYCARYELAAEPGTEQYIAENDLFAEDGDRWGKLFFSLSNDFQESVKQVMDAKGMSQDTLALELGVGRKQVYKYLTEESPSIEHVIGICVALQIPSELSGKLIKNSGNALRDSPSHYLYWQFLQVPGLLSVARCEAILKQKHMRPLFEGDGNESLRSA